MNGRAYTSPNPAVATSGGELSVDKLMFVVLGMNILELELELMIFCFW